MVLDLRVPFLQGATRYRTCFNVVLNGNRSSAATDSASPPGGIVARLRLGSIRAPACDKEAMAQWGGNYVLTSHDPLRFWYPGTQVVAE